MMNTTPNRGKGDKVYQPTDLFSMEDDLPQKEQEDFDFDELVNRFGRRIKNAK